MIRILIEEAHSTNKDEHFKQTLNLIYTLKDIKITPLELEMGFQSHGVPSNNGKAELTNGVISILTIPQLYTIAKQYDKNFLESMRGTENRFYNLKDIKITPVKANRVCDPAVPDKRAGEDTSTDVSIISVPQLYIIAK